jgi:hypothetical protein
MPYFAADVLLQGNDNSLPETSQRPAYMSVQNAKHLVMGTTWRSTGSTFRV